LSCFRSRDEWNQGRGREREREGERAPKDRPKVNPRSKPKKQLQNGQTEAAKATSDEQHSMEWAVQKKKKIKRPNTIRTQKKEESEKKQRQKVTTESVNQKRGHRRNRKYRPNRAKRIA